MEVKEKIVKFCMELGLNSIGFIRCRRFDELKSFFEERKVKGLENEFEEKDIEKRINPFLYMKEGKTIISIAFPYLYYREVRRGAYFSTYTQGSDYHHVVYKYLKQICDFIESLGGSGEAFVDSNALPERYIAALSGVGFIGKNNMIITEKYGSFVFLGEIITDMEIEADESLKNQCGDCQLCINQCPTNSIGVNGSNPNVCLSYITQKKEIDEIWQVRLKGRLFGCDSCQDICPYNKGSEFSKIVEFKPKDYMRQVNLDELINLDNKAFRERYKNTSCGWRGKKILKRNAGIYKELVIK